MTAIATQEAPAAIDSPFVQELIKQWRAQDTHGAWDGKSNADLLAPYIITREQRREIPIIGDPDPETLWRLVTVLQRRGAWRSEPPDRQHRHAEDEEVRNAGFGRMVLMHGRLVVVNKALAGEVHRFGFESVGQAGRGGHKIVTAGVEMIRQFPEVVNYGL
uniref:NifX-associated nitrogen fixation protein n=1 Tax=Herbaspirillum seropedicae TaxID=964 RepID=O87629_HERSE|nr:unknown [Herbaspirillum seropedicae]